VHAHALSGGIVYLYRAMRPTSAAEGKQGEV